MTEKTMTIITSNNNNNNNVDENERASLITQATNSTTHHQQQTFVASISRPIYNQGKFQNEFATDLKDVSHDNKSRSRQVCHKLISFIHPRNLLEIFTIINLIVEYDFKKNLFADLFSGLTGKLIKIFSFWFPEYERYL